MSGKRHVTLTLTGGVVDELKRRGINISREVDTFLPTLLGPLEPPKDVLPPGPASPQSSAVEPIQEKPGGGEFAKGERWRDEKLREYRSYARQQREQGFELEPRWYEIAAEALGMSVEEFKRAVS